MWRVGTGVSATALSQSDIWNLPIRVSITGDLLKAFDIAVIAFKEESLVPPQKRNLENYTVEFRERRGLIYVYFRAKRLPSEKQLAGGESALGKDTLYTIKKADFTIVDRKFFK